MQLPGSQSTSILSSPSMPYLAVSDSSHSWWWNTEKNIITCDRPSSIYTKVGLKSANKLIFCDSLSHKMLKLYVTLSSSSLLALHNVSKASQQWIVQVFKSWTMGQNRILHQDEHFDNATFLSRQLEGR